MLENVVIEFCLHNGILTKLFFFFFFFFFLFQSCSFLDAMDPLAKHQPERGNFVFHFVISHGPLV
jgi:hypothetical protein